MRVTLKGNMFRIFAFFFLISCFVPVKAEGGSGYTDSVKSYFSKKEEPAPHRRSMLLYVGSSVYSAAKGFKGDPFASVILGFRQQFKEVMGIGDFSLKTEIQSLKLKTGRATQINVTPVFSLPGAGSGFPVYVGLGGGIGFYPYFILDSKPSLSVNLQLFTGLRLLNLYENLGVNGELALHAHIPFREERLYMETITSLGLIFSF